MGERGIHPRYENEKHSKDGKICRICGEYIFWSVKFKEYRCGCENTQNKAKTTKIP
jgi:hypothetical protein